jgi:putative FmdB family regulatory protein
MPTYEYECKSCGHHFDVFQNIKDDPIKTCPECGKEVRRIINGGTGVIFKGGGFYVTDKGGRGGRPKPAGKTGDSSKATETKASESGPCTACANAESCPKAV